MPHPVTLWRKPLGVRHSSALIFCRFFVLKTRPTTVTSYRQNSRFVTRRVSRLPKAQTTPGPRQTSLITKAILFLIGWFEEVKVIPLNAFSLSPMFPFIVPFHCMTTTQCEYVSVVKQKRIMNILFLAAQTRWAFVYQTFILRRRLLSKSLLAASTNLNHILHPGTVRWSLHATHHGAFGPALRVSGRVSDRRDDRRCSRGRFEPPRLSLFTFDGDSLQPVIVVVSRATWT